MFTACHPFLGEDDIDNFRRSANEYRRFLEEQDRARLRDKRNGTPYVFVKVTKEDIEVRCRRGHMPTAQMLRIIAWEKAQRGAPDCTAEFLTTLATVPRFNRN